MFRNGANRDRTGDLLLAKRPLNHPTAALRANDLQAFLAATLMRRPVRLHADYLRVSRFQALPAMSAWAITIQSPSACPLVSAR
jgi:hypothetical protein